MNEENEKYNDPDLAPGQKRSEDAQKCIYGKIPAVPVLRAIDGIRYDFNHGLRVLIPQDSKYKWLVTFEDADTGAVLYRNVVDPGSFVSSVKKFYTRFRLRISPEGSSREFVDTLDLRKKLVMIQLPVGTLGDSIAWFSYVERFQNKHKCNIVVAASKFLIDIVAKQYPEMIFCAKEETEKYEPYASYYMGLFFKGDANNQPSDFRYIGLHRTAGAILGLSGNELADEPPRFDLSAKRKIKGKYCVIAAQSSSQAKYWNNPTGWMDLISMLKEEGYRVLCIDKSRAYGQGLFVNTIPYGAEDFTGNLPLQERIDLIKHADFFIGLSSGLSWLAWGCNVPVVMISGFTHPLNEFFTPYRVINYHSCNSCWNDMRCDFDHFDFMWCPRHKGDDRQFECTRSITAEQVMNTIRMIPSFKPKESK